eukprot:Lithocolla_globosa_v1_NODE_7236_length_974_cov_2.857454.p1 type:complete len:174 gc:universal NODE_7236_length_974_cov_2.857454:974-453(-)
MGLFQYWYFQNDREKTLSFEGRSHESRVTSHKRQTTNDKKKIHEMRTFSLLLLLSTLCCVYSVKSYSEDLRWRVLHAVWEGTRSVEEIAEEFRPLHYSQIYRWLQRFRETGDVAPYPSTGRSTILSIHEQQAFLELQQERPTYYLDEYKRFFLILLECYFPSAPSIVLSVDWD